MVVNKPKVAPYRAPLGPPAGFAGETLIDELATKLSMDPIEFRILNAAKEGTRRITGIPYNKIGYLEALYAAKAAGRNRVKCWTDDGLVDGLAQQAAANVKSQGSNLR